MSCSTVLLLALAQAEASGRFPDALATLDEAMATCERTGERGFGGILRVRGQVLLRQEAPTTPRPEKAFLTAIAVAKRRPRGASDSARR